jgi:hypothetical protein
MAVRRGHAGTGWNLQFEQTQAARLRAIHEIANLHLPDFYDLLTHDDLLSVGEIAIY